ncbi:hypothetical protein A8F94_09265 [Bacillus sp. FJAT-27225]|uniref:hypothetical protein n=1 Tax=Bacillus sp. FJAT-27225 TaxID=1743144 RepID=UPI00080C3185|nr:hypothetical protein [Bacillus sp. FJAT-27225]OCA88005.1 hypothetical protein A8F94_09265 [Bacillus sp. FJAT-27225]
MELISVGFTGPPAYHPIPEIYQNLGLPDLTSHVEQRFDFTVSIGKNERKGAGIIRFYKDQPDYQIIISESMPGIGPAKLIKLKELLLNELKDSFNQNILEFEPGENVIYVDFSRKK